MLVLLLLRRPPRSALLPCATLFRSRVVVGRQHAVVEPRHGQPAHAPLPVEDERPGEDGGQSRPAADPEARPRAVGQDRKSTRLNSSHANISYAVFCLKKKKYHILLC